MIIDNVKSADELKAMNVDAARFADELRAKHLREA